MVAYHQKVAVYQEKETVANHQKVAAYSRKEVVAYGQTEWDLEVEKTDVMSVTVPQVDQVQGIQIQLPGVLLVYVGCIHLCCKTIGDSRDMKG
jgi:hypothetical protein